jgi:ribA/ribD-fused uncharacterized protein
MTRFINVDGYRDDVLAGLDGSEVVVTPCLVLFWRPPNPFGQWTESPFEIDGVAYGCAEQYMMAEKARLFGDAATEERILATDDPRKQKKLGQQVVGFREDRWLAHRRDIVFRGNVAKFTQNQSLREQLLDTGDRRMVEASPLDRIWGIGLSATDPRAYDPGRWAGANLLGVVLDDVRAHLRAPAG